MYKLPIVLLAMLALAAVQPVVAATATAGERHGQTRTVSDGALLAWNNNARQWQSITNFWLDHAARNGGKYWGQSDEYPRYADVSEHDTFLVEIESGVCLMEFFHQRWRRANDVRRWSGAFNSHGGCPDVFN